MYGDLQGIIGSSLPEIDGLTVVGIEFEEGESESLPVSVSDDS